MQAIPENVVQVTVESDAYIGFKNFRFLHWNLDKSQRLLKFANHCNNENYNPTQITELCHYMTKHGSDKSISSSHDKHNYSNIYYTLFNDIRNEQLSLLEVGIGTNHLDIASSMGPTGVPGASLRAWREYFPNAWIYGADIDERILFQEDHIRTVQVDQTDPVSIAKMYSELPSVTYDIILDDGLHEFNANKTLLTNSIDKVTPGGIYIIEDIIVNQTNINEFVALATSLNMPAILMFLDHPKNIIDNCLMLVEKI